uniref:ATP synthase complex subunit 8 n=1 Tax=Arripis trutta TaxID=270544 RepID=F9V5W4_ARRTR|nr:ATP synthase F0 subunit 8 [Arripis trutta]BAK52359.1 ATPase subunit 8 [Arripis trutta]
MPQLNPTPWFPIMAFSWLVFLIVLPPKIIAHATPNVPTPLSARKEKGNTWNWPWL